MTNTAIQVGDLITVKRGALVYRVVEVGDYGRERTIMAEAVDGSRWSYFRLDRIAKI